MPILHPSDLGLILSYKCQCACAHCIYNCAPSWKDWIAPAEAEAALTAAARWAPHIQVHITGGEPFLNFPLLLHAVQTAAALGIPRYLETNAGWCVNDDLAGQRFAALRSAGLDAILISVSPFHAASIPLERALRAMAKAVEVFGSERVMVYQADWIERIARFNQSETVSLDQFTQAYHNQAAGHLFWDGYGLIPGGRAGYRLGSLKTLHPAEAFFERNCRAELLSAPHSHFDLYGNFIPGFCGGISLGDWHDLPDLIEEYAAGRYPPLIAILIERGPYGLYELARRQYDYAPLAAGYAGKCHLCVDIRRHLAGQGQFPELQPREFYTSF